jgi:hypothetical protein
MLCLIHGFADLFRIAADFTDLVDNELLDFCGRGRFRRAGVPTPFLGAAVDRCLLFSLVDLECDIEMWPRIH